MSGRSLARMGSAGRDPSGRTRGQSPRGLAKLRAEWGGGEPVREGARESARSNQPGLTRRDELAEPDDPGEPFVQVTGVGLDDKINVLALVLLAHRHAVAV